MRGTIVTFLVSTIACCICFLDGSVSQATTQPCSNYKIVYARGSGQNVKATVTEDGYEKEREQLIHSLNTNLGPKKYSFIELEGNSMGVLGEYDAIKVNEEEILTGVFATVSSGKLGKYKKSVDGGVDLLNKYLDSANKIDPENCFILTGYSQGAHVVGDLLEKYNDADYIQQIKYVGLLGDPKLDLEGFGGFGILPGTNIPWYRGNAIPLLNFGWLGSRNPDYLPRQDNSTKIPSASWCYSDDPLCSSYILKGFGGHNKYPERAVPQMALEIANVINNPSGIIDKNKRPAETCGPAKQDIVVMLDTSPMMRRDATVFTDTPMYYGGKTPQTPPTAGEMLARTGCGDTRFAVMGYGRVQDGPPRLLLDFTKDPKAYDSLMKSLYEPNSTGTYERTQFREAAIKALDVSWRSDAGKVLFAITDTAGSGPVGHEGWRGWERRSVQDAYMQDTLSQQVIKKVREHDAIILGVPVTRNSDGFQASNTESHSLYDAQRYLRFISSQTGGYMWVKQVPNYGPYNFKFTHVDQTINYATQLREKTVGSVASVRGIVGQPVTLKFNDTIGMFAAAALRSDSTNYTWHVDCSNSNKRLYEVRQEATFMPDQPGKCTGAVIVRTIGNGNGCYSCPEPFPPYMYRAIPFNIDIKPANYIPKIPTQLTDIEKIIYDSEVAYSWEKPVYAGSEELVYVIRESDGNVLAATTAQKLVITETDRTDPLITISAAGEDGVSEAIASTTVQTVDMRTPVNLPEVSVDRRGDEEVLGSINTITTATLATVPIPQYLLDTLPSDKETNLGVISDEVAVLGLEVAHGHSPVPMSNVARAEGKNMDQYVIALVAIISLLGVITGRLLLFRKS